MGSHQVWISLLQTVLPASTSRAVRSPNTKPWGREEVKCNFTGLSPDWFFITLMGCSRTAVSLASLSRLTSLPRWRSRLRLTSMVRRCSSVGLSNATWWTNSAMTPADNSRGLQTVATTTTLEQAHIQSFHYKQGSSVTACRTTSTHGP